MKNEFGPYEEPEMESGEEAAIRASKTPGARVLTADGQRSYIHVDELGPALDWRGVCQAYADDLNRISDMVKESSRLKRTVPYTADTVFEKDPPNPNRREERIAKLIAYFSPKNGISKQMTRERAEVIADENHKDADERAKHYDAAWAALRDAFNPGDVYHEFVHNHGSMAMRHGFVLLRAGKIVAALRNLHARHSSTFQLTTLND